MENENKTAGGSLSNEAMEELLKGSVLLNPDFWEEEWDSDSGKEAQPPEEKEPPPEGPDPFQMDMPMDMPIEEEKPEPEKNKAQKGLPAPKERKPRRFLKERLPGRFFKKPPEKKKAGGGQNAEKTPPESFPSAFSGAKRQRADAPKNPMDGRTPKPQTHLTFAPRHPKADDIMPKPREKWPDTQKIDKKPPPRPVNYFKGYLKPQLPKIEKPDKPEVPKKEKTNYMGINPKRKPFLVYKPARVEKSKVEKAWTMQSFKKLQMK